MAEKMITLTVTRTERRVVEDVITEEIQRPGEVYRGWWIHEPVRQPANTWDITHPGTGLLGGSYAWSKAAARRLVDRLVALGIDPQAPDMAGVDRAAYEAAYSAWRQDEARQPRAGS